MYGHLTVICGPMFAGKTTELLKRILWAKNGLGKRTAVYKCAYDTRYKITEIVSHDGLQATAGIIRSWSGAPEAEHVFFDEVQFFTAPFFDGDIVTIIKSLLQSGIDVTVASLDADWQGNPLPTVGLLASMADEVVKLRSHCSVCGRPATKTFKRTPNSNSLELGGSEMYEPRCNTHWHWHPNADLFAADDDSDDGAVAGAA
ncbi:MAG: thymidine kinase [Bdellovibrionales bacterium]